MEKRRIQVYADKETKRRVELAAAKHHMPVTAYCLAAIRQQLADDDMLDRDQIEIPVVPVQEEDLAAQLNALHDRILTRRGGRPIDIDILGQIREERDHELTGMC